MCSVLRITASVNPKGTLIALVAIVAIRAIAEVSKEAHPANKT